jgi:hypothetical protein
MPSATAHADAKSIAKWLANVFAQTDCVIYETYSRPNAEASRFSSLPSLLAAYPLDARDTVSGTYQFSLWSPTVMPEPRVKRIELKDLTFRYTVQGCGLYSLLVSAEDGSGLRSCEFSYWSEAGACQRCAVEPGPSSVNWTAHKRLGASLARQFKHLSNAL